MIFRSCIFEAIHFLARKPTLYSNMATFKLLSAVQGTLINY